ncbi:hypothetical protein JRO89_XS03G0299000 [Xanthoceras sorbifolium]|uniref:MADS-box domain-containing protein n=1 Tax=Xanthoceras sorbifolium TaxID=99658 RepID=A0ABQ8ICR8_9ROSI|nr:hypothetical protein JRO89_XS03G0299000 [Xanthoceras sorbifolium]
MGRNRLIIKRLNNPKARQTTYSKRKIGILKKAKELSVMCDVDLALIMFSPSGIPTLFVGQNKRLHGVMERLLKMSIENREKRRNYTVKLLKKMYNNTEINPRNFSLDKAEFLKFQQDQLRELNEKIAHKTKILSEWKNPQKINNLNQIQIMQNHLAASLNNIRAKKRELIIQEKEQQRRLRASQINNNLFI